MLLATLIPKGATAPNPPALYGEALENDIDGLVEKIPPHEDDKDVPRNGSVTAGLEDAVLPVESSPVVHHHLPPPN
ncbi:hypothetical protein AC578_2141 [Pseudocercospora eumusae]|uniref:Uncharacterized protein n=1 Tax=Pseudocercospora eumusae TaxID=321146 RepID=A0A139HQA1_9PEZI|nr:hypothetical protein AC578_2141 [Pseudocercospora eumusae]